MDLTITDKLWPDMELINDEFSKELVDLWEKRGMCGKIFTIHEDVRRMTPTRGYVLLERTGEKSTIRGFWIDSSFRKKGEGTQLLKTVCGWCDTAGIKDLYVNITESEGNLYLYKKLGFKVLGKREDFPGQTRAVRHCPQVL